MVQVSVMFVLQGVVYVIVCWLTTAQWLLVLVCVGDPVVTCAVDGVMVERGAVAFDSVTCVVGERVLWCCLAWEPHPLGVIRHPAGHLQVRSLMKGLR